MKLHNTYQQDEMRRYNDSQNRIHLPNSLANAGIALKDLLKRTSAEIAIFALLGLGIGGYSAHRHEMNRQRIPLAFSEIEAIEDAAKKRGDTLGPINVYQLKTNDMCMKIFEAYNESLDKSSPTEAFAARIYDAYDYRNIYRYNLEDLLEQIPTYKPAILEEILDFKITAKTLAATNQNFEDARVDTHHDNYHTEVRIRTVTDGKGHSHIETYTVQVYDNTDHDYEYDKINGEQGAKSLSNHFRQIPTLKVREQFHISSLTNADGEYAAEQSRKNHGGEKLTQEELLAIANSWYTGSTIREDLNLISKNYPLLQKRAATWNASKANAHSEHYKTYSHSDDGPQTFQDAENVLKTGVELKESLDELLKVVEETSLQVPILEKKIKQFIEIGYVSYSSHKTESQKLSKEIMQLTKQIYILNFKKGVEVQRYRRRVLFLGSLLGGLLGAGIGAGVDYITAEKNLYDKKRLGSKLF